MALQGTLDCFGIAEVVRLVGAGGKRGRVRVVAPGVKASVFLDDGRIVGARFAGSEDTTGAVDVVFELMRLSTGEFGFHPDEAPKGTREDLAVEDVLNEAQGHLEEWHRIERVLPSMEHWVTLCPVIEKGVSIEPSEWSVLASIGGGKQVRSLADRAGTALVGACTGLVALVERGLLAVSIEAPPTAALVVDSRPVEAQKPSVGAPENDPHAAAAPESPAEETAPSTPSNPTPAPASPPAEPSADVAAADAAPAPVGAPADPALAAAAELDDADLNPRALLRFLNNR